MSASAASFCLGLTFVAHEVINSKVPVKEQAGLVLESGTGVAVSSSDRPKDKKRVNFVSLYQ